MASQFLSKQCIHHFHARLRTVFPARVKLFDVKRNRYYWRAEVVDSAPRVSVGVDGSPGWRRTAGRRGLVHLRADGEEEDSREVEKDPTAHPFTPSKTPEEAELSMLKNAEFIENMREEDCDLLTEQDRLDFHAFKKKMGPAMRLIAKSTLDNTFFNPIQKLNYILGSLFLQANHLINHCTCREEHLSAEDMEAQISARFPDRKPCQQAKDFAELALAHYNEKNKTSGFELATTLLSNCFSESSGDIYGHVNFTAVPKKQTASKTKRLCFAELMHTPSLEAYARAQPMRVLRVCTIDDDSCYGGCHEIFRKIDNKRSDDMDYERCHACSDRIKHPNGQLFDGGHNSSRMPYYSA
ncbi:hypothetical protein TRIUR3_20311 [Triticum urartu]|uniref:DUF3615 domain-containing protein n=1 Tax=Triticum urartu TaxID=4572 RepID=M7YEL6_TRIUA|nr:hypothetical protein TRIUR3_20311 [Triticum urartu]